MLIECSKEFCRLSDGHSETQDLMACENVLYTDLIVFEQKDNSITGYCDAVNCWELRGPINNSLCIVANQQLNLSNETQQEELLNIQKQIFELNSVTALIFEEAQSIAISVSIYMICSTALVTGILIFQSAHIFRSVFKCLFKK